MNDPVYYNLTLRQMLELLIERNLYAPRAEEFFERLEVLLLKASWEELHAPGMAELLDVFNRKLDAYKKASPQLKYCLGRIHGLRGFVGKRLEELMPVELTDELEFRILEHLRRFDGPMPLDHLAAELDMDKDTLRQIIEQLEDSKRVHRMELLKLGPHGMHRLHQLEEKGVGNR